MRDIALKTGNLKLKEEICMLKTKNLKLVNDFKTACVSDVESQMPNVHPRDVALKTEN